jgi:secondary thiamine-phosphate synthase enzyme
MNFFEGEIEISTGGELEVIDITHSVVDFVNKHKIKEGIVNLFLPGSTGALTTIEYEAGLIADFKEILKNLVPKEEKYSHNLAWQDGNAHSHLRASFLGSSLSIPIRKGTLALGTWQQIVFVELDVRPRKRRILVSVVGND